MELYENSGKTIDKEKIDKILYEFFGERVEHIANIKKVDEQDLRDALSVYLIECGPISTILNDVVEKRHSKEIPYE